MAKSPIRSRAAVSGHPMHPALIHFPIAALFMLVGSDVAFLLSGDPFWARASLWLAGIGATVGTLSGIAGTIDLVTVARIRRLVTAWAHGLLAVMLLSLSFFNYLLRLDDAVAHVIPWGLYISLLTLALILATGYLGAQLVFEYAIGVDFEEATERDVKP